MLVLIVEAMSEADTLIAAAVIQQPQEQPPP